MYRPESGYNCTAGSHRIDFLCSDSSSQAGTNDLAPPPETRHHRRHCSQQTHHNMGKMAAIGVVFYISTLGGSVGVRPPYSKSTKSFTQIIFLIKALFLEKSLSVMILFIWVPFSFPASNPWWFVSKVQACSTSSTFISSIKENPKSHQHEYVECYVNVHKLVIPHKEYA